MIEAQTAETDSPLEYAIGIDVGGTNTKFGIVKFNFILYHIFTCYIHWYTCIYVNIL